jgi:hypothetical protein
MKTPKLIEKTQDYLGLDKGKQIKKIDCLKELLKKLKKKEHELKKMRDNEKDSRKCKEVERDLAVIYCQRKKGVKILKHAKKS